MLGVCWLTGEHRERGAFPGSIDTQQTEALSLWNSQ